MRLPWLWLPIALSACTTTPGVSGFFGTGAGFGPRTPTATLPSALPSLAAPTTAPSPPASPVPSPATSSAPSPTAPPHPSPSPVLRPSPAPAESPLAPTAPPSPGPQVFTLVDAYTMLPIVFDAPTAIAHDGVHTLYVSSEGGEITAWTPSSTHWHPEGTIAGASAGGYNDAGGTSARFRSPRGLAVAPDGALIVADTGNNCLRRIADSGLVTTLAGALAAGYQDGTSAQCRFNGPSGVAVTPDGWIYVADTRNHAIRRRAPSGAVSTLAGDGTAGSSDGVGPAARFDSPTAIALGPDGALYVADTGNQLIRRVTRQGAVSVFAGAGSAGDQDGPALAARLHDPRGLTWTASGDLVIADAGNHQLRAWRPGPAGVGVVLTLAGTGASGAWGGSPLQSAFNAPWGVVSAPTGALYVTDTGNNCLRIYDAP